MKMKADRPKETREFDGVWKNFALGAVIASGALLWGYAVYHVAMRTI